jgi:hypothetical protein
MTLSYIENLTMKVFRYVHFVQTIMQHYVAVEETYGDHSYNGHAKKDEAYRNNMTNFGILMEINGIEDPFAWSRNVVSKLQVHTILVYIIVHLANHQLHLKVIM